MRIINIFLASSVDEFKEDRNELQCFIDDVAENFRDNYGIDIRVQRCEKVDPRYVKGRSQDEFNELIKNSEMCIFLFFTKAGEYTVEEFETAKKAYEMSENGKPKIYTYFKYQNGVSVDKSVINFMTLLDKSLNHFYQTFTHIDTVKLRVLLNLKLQEMDFVSVEFENGKCLVDGREALDMSNVSEFANNTLLKELKSQLEDAEQEYLKLKPLYESGKADEELCRTYAKAASKRQSLKEQIEELQKNIFDISMRMCRDEMRGEITKRQKEAYRLFELGDFEGANAILDFDEIVSDYQRRKEIRKKEQIKDAVIFIRESVTKIEILSAMKDYKNRFRDIDNIYETIVPEILEYEVELKTLYDYASYLDKQGKSSKAYDILNKLISIFNKTKSNDILLISMVSNLMGIICDNLHRAEEAEKYYLEAIRIHERLTKENPERYSAYLALSYNNAGAFYDHQGKAKKAEKYFLAAVRIREQLACENPERYSADLARSYNNAGIFYKNQGEPKKAEKYYLVAIRIYEQLTKENPERYSADLAMGYNDAGIFYINQGQAEKAEKYFLAAVRIREQLACENPERYSADLAMSYNNTGVFYNDEGEPEKAEKYYLESIRIRERLAKENPERYSADLATSYNNAGVFYKNQGEPEKAAKYYLEAIRIYERLTKENPERYSADLANSYNNAGVFYDDQGKAEKAEKYYLEAIRIREQLTRENPERYSADLAMSYNNAGAFYDDQGKAEKAEKYYLEAIRIRERLAKENPERYSADLARSYNNAGGFYNAQGKPEKAQKYYLEAIRLREQLAKENPERYSADLAVSYFNYAVSKNDDLYEKKAYKLALLYPANPYCRQIINMLSNKQ